MPSAMNVAAAFRRNGTGYVPPMPSLVAAAKKELGEVISEADKFVYDTRGRTPSLDFSLEGAKPSDVRAFFNELGKASKKQEPMVESGNKYAVDLATRTDFHSINSAILMGYVPLEERSSDAALELVLT